MAIKINANQVRQQIFAKQPDVQVDITLDDGDHTWTLHGGGTMLRSELSRYLLVTRDLGNLSKNAENDEQANAEILQEMNQAWKRFESCFLANMTSDDGSSEKWIGQCQYDYVVMPAIINQILDQVEGAND